ATHEPRARNHAADALANLALDDPAAAARVMAEVAARSGLAVGLDESALGRVASIGQRGGRTVAGRAGDRAVRGKSELHDAG
ncbi:MAG: hypothetical protein ACREA1_06990, partial [Nitrosotalea sp.]